MKQIKVYTTQSCVYCTKAKDFIKSRGFSYEEINLGENPMEFQSMQDKTGAMSVPVIEIGKKFIVGFNPRQLEEALKL